MWRAFTTWLTNVFIAIEEAEQKRHRAKYGDPYQESMARWNALSLEEREARLAKANAERIAAEAAREAAALKTFPYELITVPGNQGLATFERLRAEGRGTPIILGDKIDQVRANITARRRPPQAILARAAKLQHPADEIKAYLGAHPRTAAEAGSDEDFFPDGETPADIDGDAPLIESGAPYNARATVEHCQIAVLPTQDWTEAPAYLSFGGFNSCPAPETHIAALRAWRDRYGAELVCANADTLEFRVARPPRTGAEAMALAEEHYAYCGAQGAESMGEIAAELLNAGWWYFWWD